MPGSIYPPKHCLFARLIKQASQYASAKPDLTCFHLARHISVRKITQAGLRPSLQAQRSRTIMKKLVLITVVLLLAACATKQYPQAPAVTNEEALALDCQALEREIAKTHGIQQEIKQTSDFDFRTVLGFLGDFGIGNGIARHNASEKAKSRLSELQALRDVKCSAR